jgi:hypothetical protein
MSWEKRRWESRNAKIIRLPVTRFPRRWNPTLENPGRKL